nr:MAG TPA: hypothetical protein [Bacteriophage sp.]
MTLNRFRFIIITVKRTYKKAARPYQERTATNQKRKVSRLYHNRRNGTRL